MKKLIVGAIFTLAVAGCVKPEQVTRGEQPGLNLVASEAPEGAIALDVAVTEINVVVPTELKVSEANTFKPKADIVWREDPIGNRHEQVQVIVADAMKRGADRLTGSRSVVLDVTVNEFHALTQRTRYTVGGTHAINFTYLLRDAETGAVIKEAETVQADLRAFGGGEALAAEARGETQKVRITAHLANVIQQELSFAPEAEAGA